VSLENPVSGQNISLGECRTLELRLEQLSERADLTGVENHLADLDLRLSSIEGDYLTSKDIGTGGDASDVMTYVSVDTTNNEGER